MSSEIEGRQGAPFTMVVERGKISEFARATKSHNPDYLDGDRPLSPVTFLASSAFWQDASNSAWGDGPKNFERILHGEQEFVFFGEPPRAGDVLTGVSRIERVYEKEGRRGGAMTFTEAVTEFRDPDGKLVAESRTTSIETGQAPTSEGAS
jgi:N-terminal half of MaoC dehydratase